MRSGQQLFLAGQIIGRLGISGPMPHRGTPLTESLLNALRDPETGHPRLGHDKFELATFEGAASFESAIFCRRASRSSRKHPASCPSSGRAVKVP
ncbi:hypothetical protein GCM10023323_70280 [Streptomyces thinghirensis]|uniref:Uncharacterized protein n=1 Tax=Streptomyces thinghirensis TaxID=551547 RepID=A0ABP9TD21_9ACTN